MRIPGITFELVNLNNDDLKKFEEPFMLAQYPGDGMVVASQMVDREEPEDEGLITAPFEEVKELGRVTEEQVNDENNEEFYGLEYNQLYVLCETTEGTRYFYLGDFLIFVR